MDQLAVLGLGVALDSGELIDVAKREGFEEFAGFAHVFDEAAPAHPPRRPLLAVAVHQILEPLGIR